MFQITPVEDETMSPSKRDFQQAMSDNLNGDSLNSKILSYNSKPPTAPEGKFFLLPFLNEEDIV